MTHKGHSIAEPGVKDEVRAVSRAGQEAPLQLGLQAASTSLHTRKAAGHGKVQGCVVAKLKVQAWVEGFGLGAPASHVEVQVERRGEAGRLLRGMW